VLLVQLGSSREELLRLVLRLEAHREELTRVALV
jgi:hypothetical protein